jgi:hypothetical protein
MKDTIQLILSALIGAGIASSVFVVGRDAAPPLVESDVLFAGVAPEIRDEIKEVGPGPYSCAKKSTLVDDGDTETLLWFCNGAAMSPRVQAALDAAERAIVEAAP